MSHGHGHGGGNGCGRGHGHILSRTNIVVNSCPSSEDNASEDDDRICNIECDREVQCMLDNVIVDRSKVIYQNCNFKLVHWLFINNKGLINFAF